MRRILMLLALSVLAGTAGCDLLDTRRDDGTPDWVRTPTTPSDEARFLVATGASRAGVDPELAQDDADRAARAKLDEAVTDYTHDVVSAFLDADEARPPSGSPLAADFLALIEAEVSAGVLRQATSQDVWGTPQGRVYVLYRIPLGVLHEVIVNRAHYALDHVNPFGADDLQQAAALQAFLTGRLQGRLKKAIAERPVEPTAPPEEQVPGWLGMGEPEGYPHNLFLTAVGVGKDKAEAEMAALGELSLAADTELQRLVRRVRAAEANTPLAQGLEAAKGRLPSFVAEPPVGRKIAESWHDELTGTDYALAVLDRQSACDLYGRKAVDLQGEASRLSTSARNHMKVGNYVASLQDYLACTVSATAAIRVQIKALALASDDQRASVAGLFDRPVLPQALAQVDSLLAALAVRKTAGDGQWIVPGRPPAAPFEVRLVLAETGDPVSGVEMALSMPGLPEPLAQAITDADGAARFVLTEPLPGSEPEPRLVAQLRMDRLAPEGVAYAAEAPRAEFKCVVRSKGTVQFAVCLREKTLSGSAVPTTAEGVLRHAMAKDGLAVVDPSLVRTALQSVPTAAEGWDEAALAALMDLETPDSAAGHVLLLLGSLEPSISEEVEVDDGKLYIADCAFTAEAIDPALPTATRTVLAVSGRGSSAYLGDAVEALKRARSEATAQIAQLVVAGLSAKLGTAADASPAP